MEHSNKKNCRNKMMKWKTRIFSKMISNLTKILMIFRKKARNRMEHF